MTAGRILIVDDARDNLKMLATLLALDGYLVRAATSGAEALAAVEAEQPDLILLDIRMPDIGGLEVCRRLKAEARHEAIPVIFLSAVSDAADKVAAFRCGGADYVTKPVQQEELRARIAHQLEIRRLRQELERKAEQELDRFFELAPELLCIAGLDGRFRRLSRSWEGVLGWSRGELADQPFLGLIHPDDLEATRAAMGRLGRSEPVQGFVNRYGHRDGSWRWVEWNAHVTGGGAIYAVARDITERRRAEEELRRAREELEQRIAERTQALRVELAERLKAEASLRKLSRAVEQNPNMIFITDLDGRIEYVNRKFVELTGYTAEEAIGRNPRMIKSRETPPEIYERMWCTILDGRDWAGEIKDRRKDGRIFWASASINPVRDEAGRITHFVAMHEDITARKLAEEEIRNAKEQAEVANRAKTELLANMSHELRTPLNAIIGYSEAMLEGIFGGFANRRQQEYVGDIRSSGMHLLSLINDILDVSAIEAGKVELGEEVVDLRDVADTTLRLVGPRASKGNVTLTARLPAGLPRLWGDSRRLKQILLNLLSNAVKFTPEGGSVTVSAATALDGGIVLRVADTGIGMEPHELEKALSRFGQVDSGLNRRHEGTGLGLPLTKGLIELHGGTMTIDSAKWAGTTVQVSFPPERSRLERTAEIIR